MDVEKNQTVLKVNNKTNSSPPLPHSQVNSSSTFQLSLLMTFSILLSNTHALLILDSSVYYP